MSKLLKNTRPTTYVGIGTKCHQTPRGPENSRCHCLHDLDLGLKDVQLFLAKWGPLDS